MATTYTPYYSYDKPGSTDAVDISVLNGNFQDIDTDLYAANTRSANNPGGGRSISAIPEIATERATYTTVADFLKARADAANWAGLRVGDYSDIVVGSQTFRYRIAGFDHYYNCGDTARKHHIVMVPDDGWGTNVQWNTTNNNNGTAEQEHPYLASNAYDYLINTLLPQFPAAWRNVMQTHRVMLEKRYAAGQTLSASTGWGWADIGKLWLPSETEVYGQCVWGTPGYSVGMDHKFPLFDSRYAALHARTYRWLRTVHGSNSTSVCNVYNVGNANYHNASYTNIRLWPCFLVGSN